MKRIVTSLGMVVFVGALVVAGTGAFFSDTETSTANTFTAGALDLKVDSTAHYNGMVCTDDDGELTWQPEPGRFPDDVVPADHYPQPDTECWGTWEESDLIQDALEFRFFNLTDIKPGDEGENTISLHVYNNDAWGCFLVDNVEDNDNDCTEPETDSTDPECSIQEPGTNLGANGLGELGAAITFDAWLDQGAIAGFQCNDPENEATAGASCAADPTEGDNIYQENEGPLFWDDETVDEASEGPFDIKDVLSAAYDIEECTVATGNTEYGACHGLAEDGRMVGSATYYFGLAWNIPDTVGNEAQTDSLVTDMVFEAVQHRNNPDFSCTPREVEEETTLTLAKAVLPPEAALDGAFTLSADGALTDISGVEGAAAVTNADVEPGVYALSESGGPENATSRTWSCSGMTGEGGFTDNGNGTATVDIAEGDTVICGITNNYNPIQVIDPQGA